MEVSPVGKLELCGVSKRPDGCQHGTGNQVDLQINPLSNCTSETTALEPFTCDILEEWYKCVEDRIV